MYAWREATQRTIQLGGDIETAEDMVAKDEAAAERIAQSGGLNPA